MSLYDIVIPARDEERTIAPVITAALAARGVGRVIVVDDHSGDSTADVARAAGAEVLLSRGMKDKAKALATGVEVSTSEVLVFFDGDLLSAAPVHFEALALPVVTGQVVMCCGLVDYGVRTRIFRWLPPITGLRALQRRIFEAVPDSKRLGFKIEIMINEVVARGRMPSGMRVLSGLSHVTKIAKNGWRKGAPAHLKMTAQLLDCFRTVPLWTYPAYLSNLVILDSTDEIPPEALSLLAEHPSNLMTGT